MYETSSYACFVASWTTRSTRGEPIASSTALCSYSSTVRQSHRQHEDDVRGDLEITLKFFQTVQSDSNNISLFSFQFS